MISFNLLEAGQLATLRGLLASGPWEDGRATAGPQAAAVKNNRQLAKGEALDQARQIVVGALERSPAFLAAALPRRILPPAFNRYAGGSNHYGPHIDSAVRMSDGRRLRTDLSCTVFISDPADYEGGELVLHDAGLRQKVKLAAGQVVLYPSTRVHEVLPVTRGERLASFFWVESLVRSNEQRHLLHEFDKALMAVRRQGETEATVALTGVYHNLLRFWAET
jgi:PKHD-type hydroxylase